MVSAIFSPFLKVKCTQLSAKISQNIQDTIGHLFWFQKLYTCNSISNKKAKKKKGFFQHLTELTKLNRPGILTVHTDYFISLTKLFALYKMLTTII